MVYKLIDEKTGAEIKPGDVVTTFRDEKYILNSFVALAPPSTGRVYIKRVDGNFFESGYYPSVIGAKIIEVA